MEAVKLSHSTRVVPVNRAALEQLSTLLKFVLIPAKQNDERVQTLRSLNWSFLIICGLCLTQKSVETMK